MPDPAPAPLIDANLLLWAHHRQFPHHQAAHHWWKETMSTLPLIGIPWPTVLAFVRISTHPRALGHPLSIDQAWYAARGWLESPNVWVPVPTERHQAILATQLLNGHGTGNHAMDAHLAALAIEWGLELLSADRDFARYPDLRWRDPITSR